jgi:hypothetical protein
MTIRFRNPRLERMHSKNLCVELTGAGTWESFEGFAQNWIAQIGAKLHERFDGPDARVWYVVFENHKVALVYRDYPNGVSIEAMDADSNAAIEKLFFIVSSEAVPNGI